MKKALLAAGLVGAMTTGAASGQQPAFAIPEITVTPDDAGYAIVGRLVGLSSATVKSTLTIGKAGPSGTVNTRQSREILLAAGKTEIVARTTLSADADTTLNITLEIFKDERPAGSAVVTIRPPEE